MDTCRDNPFGNLKGVDHKGLSQMDAPTHTILAYATSPGNVASDGDGANGLYTENLLKELKVPEAKVEDVFKRVRLGVRVRSKGAQIPWESTSLEKDFWFIPPKEMKAASEAEKARLFAEELALWEKIKSSADPVPLQDFLGRFPSGPFSELAQLQLDLVLAKQGEKRIEVASSTGNPFTQGSGRADLGFKVGDEYFYRVLDLESKAEKRTQGGKVTEVRETEVHFAGGRLILDRLGNLIQLADGRRYTPWQDQPLEYAIGKKWNTRFSVLNEKTGHGAELEFEYRIVRREKVTVPAGTFDCFVVDGFAEGVSPEGAKVTTREIRWMAPDKVRRPIAAEIVRKIFIPRKPPAPPVGMRDAFRKGPPTLPPIERIDQSERMELVAFKQS